MQDLIDELQVIYADIEAQLDTLANPQITEPLDALDECANEAAGSFSGSWLGYHARVYYKGLQAPPPGAHFSVEWGRNFAYNEGTTGEWMEYGQGAVEEEIKQCAGDPDLSTIRTATRECRRFIDEKREDIVSILNTAISVHSDSVLEKLTKSAEEIKCLTVTDFVKYFAPSGNLSTRDTVAAYAGLKTPPHIAILADVYALKAPKSTCESMRDIVRQATSHLRRTQKSKKGQIMHDRVYIGHGHSLLWRHLKDFLQDDLKLQWDEFNRVPTAGMPIIQRLSDMLDHSAIAFLVLTAEDESKDGKLQARLNVIHEVGLFQGRLGFTKAIVMLEEGCEEFSNIHGLGQIRFPANNIQAAFHEVRKKLEHEGIIPSP